MGIENMSLWYGLENRYRMEFEIVQNVHVVVSYIVLESAEFCFWFDLMSGSIVISEIVLFTFREFWKKKTKTTKTKSYSNKQ